MFRRKLESVEKYNCYFHWKVGVALEGQSEDQQLE